MRTIVKHSSLQLFLLAAVVTTAFGNSELKDLYDKKQYFELRDRLAVIKNDPKDPGLLFYRATVENKFNRPSASIVLLKKYLESPSAENDQTLYTEAFTLLADNYVKTYQYANAAKTYELILSKFSATLGERERSSYQNVLGLWKGLSNVAPQKVSFRGDSNLQAVQEPVGLMVPLSVNGQSGSFIFDTGANLSTITESQAAKLGLTIIETSFDVASITGNMVKAKIGIAKDLAIGNAHLSNVVFIVFPDKALYIEPIKHQIHGILGFPAIEALREITLTKTKQLSIPAKRSEIKHRNLCLDGLTPLIAGVYEGRTLTFSFDTGARTSSLYPPFFKAFEKSITAVGSSFTATVTGAGGSRKVNAYKMENLAIEFAGKKPVFKTVEVFTEETTRNSRLLYGNIGRDMIDQHEKMTINFKSMGVYFE